MEQNKTVNAPLVSIVIPAYNCEKYIEGCIQNVLNQSYQNLQIIIVDDGSKDDTYAICRRFTDPRITLTHKENGGASSARNAGLRLSKGDYILFADSDDDLEQDAVRLLVEKSQRTNADLIYFEANNFSDDPAIKAKEKGFSQKMDYPVMSGNALIPLLVENKDYHAAPFLFFTKREVFQHGLHFYEGIMMEDELFSFRLLRSCDKVVCLRKELYHRRVRAGSVMTSQGKEEFRYNSIQTVFQELLKEQTKGIQDNTLTLYLARVGMLVVGYWEQLPSNGKRRFRDQYRAVRKIIRNEAGFGSAELLARTYGRLLWTVFALPRRIKKVLNGLHR